MPVKPTPTGSIDRVNPLDTSTAVTGNHPPQTYLQKLWGYRDFRPPQGEIVECLLAGQDALIILPTGGGKSICFQLPALMQPGLTLVLSPLVALMENQVQELWERHPRLKGQVAVLHSQRSAQERRQTLRALEQGQLRLLYLSPETLLSPPVWERLCQPQLAIRRLVLDEAHCLTQWGETFRPSYYRLGAVRPALLAQKPPNQSIAIAAFTATADPTAQATIQRILQLQNPKIFRQNPYRSNLNLGVQVVWTPRQRRQRLLEVIRSHPHQSGLVYVRTRRDSEELAAWLQQQGLATAAYHAGLSPRDRRQIEQQWLTGQLPFVICTCAFGMGINKPDCRWVLHFHAPLLLSEYVQEVGRAGRDGKTAIALTLISEPTGWLDHADKQRQQAFLAKERSQQQKAQQIARKLSPVGKADTVQQQFRQDGAIALALLHSAGQLDWQTPFDYEIQSRTVNLAATNAKATEQMQRFLHSRNCRWALLLAAFGFPTETDAWRCGHCDNCRR